MAEWRVQSLYEWLSGCGYSKKNPSTRAQSYINIISHVITCPICSCHDFPICSACCSQCTMDFSMTSGPPPPVTAIGPWRSLQKRLPMASKTMPPTPRKASAARNLTLASGSSGFTKPVGWTWRDPVHPHGMP